MTQLDLETFRNRYLAGEPVRLGLGMRPAILVVDFIEGFSGADSPLAGPWASQVACTARLLEKAHQRGAPVIFTTVEYAPGETADNLLVRKAPRVGLLERGSPWCEIDHRLPRSDTDLVIVKKHGSAFFGTDLTARLRGLGVDTLLVTGCVTSGCVRASVVDAAQHGYRTLTIRDATGDRSPLAHEANLLDIEARYGDVASSETALAWLDSITGPRP